MKVSEEHQAFAEVLNFALNGLFDFHDHLRTLPYFSSRAHNLGPCLLVVVVGHRRELARLTLDEDFVPGVDERLHSGRHDADPRLVIFYLFGYADNHGLGPSKSFLLRPIDAGICANTVTRSPDGRITLFSGIDLGPLQAVGIVHVDRLPLRIEVDRSDSSLAMSITSGFGTAKRKMHFRANRRSVDVGDAGVQVAHSLECLVYITRVHR